MPPATAAPPPADPPSRSARARSAVGRALRWVGRHIRRFAVWLWTHLRAGALRVWREVRNAESGRAMRAAWAVGGVAGTGAVLAAAAVMLVALYALVLWPFTPSVSDLRSAREVDPSIVLSADGTELTRYARSGREWKQLDEVSPYVVQALVATEDRRFRRHGGIDLIGWGAVAKDVLTGNGLRGASTITQQLARNLFPERVGNAGSLTRKLREGITALKIERVYTKDEILELYLNSVPFLYNAVGIEMAARTYFSTDAGSLDQVQAATLVGMLKGTYSYNPYRNPERALARRNVVLGQWVRFGELDPDHAARLATVPLGLDFERQPMQRSRAPHFTEHVRVTLERWADRNGYNLYGDGLTIHTTLDWRMQQAAQESATRFGDALQTVADVEWGRADGVRLGPTTAPYYQAARRTQPFEQFWDLRRDAANAFIRDTRAYQRAVDRGRSAQAVLDSLRATPAFLDSLRQVKMRLEVAVTAVDPETGHVRAWVGSRDFGRSAYDHVARARRQPGSTFKPFLYARALEEGWRPSDEIADDTISVALSGDEIWRPTNASGTVSGERVTLRDGLASSKNTVAARLVLDVGPRDVARTARRMGIESELDAVPALALGTSEVSLLEMTAAYATIAAGGMRRPPVVVTHVTDRDGVEIARFDDARARRALDAEVAVDLLDMMRGVVDGGTGRQVRSSFGARGDLAGKTGTTQDGADGWFLLMRPDLVTGAWVGFDDPRVTFRSSYWGQGGHNALRIVGDLNRLLQRRSLVRTAATFPRPPEDADDDRGPALLDRVGDWFAGLGDRIGEAFARDDADVPDGYGPNTPWRTREPARYDRALDDVEDAIRADNADWLEDAIADLDRIEDPRLRDAARSVLREAARDFRREGDRRGWAERVRSARDRALAQAQREIEREIEDAARDAGFFVEEDLDGAFDDEALDEVVPIEEAPVVPEPPPARSENVPSEAGRIGW